MPSLSAENGDVRPDRRLEEIDKSELHSEGLSYILST